jgi:hypothetical protein
MTMERVRADLDRIVAGVGELSAGVVDYEEALDDYVAALVAAHDGDASRIWSIDGVHLEHLP